MQFKFKWSERVINDDNVKEGSQPLYKSNISQVLTPIVSTLCSFGFYAIALSTPAFSTDRILTLAELSLGLSLIWLFFSGAKIYKSR